MSVPHAGAPKVDFMTVVDALYPDRFFYIRYFQDIGVGEAELATVDLPKGAETDLLERQRRGRETPQRAACAA